MNRFPRLLTSFLLASMVSTMLVLGACSSSGVKSEQLSHFEKKADMKLESWKDGQFLLNGAVLSSMDLSSHLAYLRDQHRLPHLVLLTNNDEHKIKKAQVLSLARMSITFGFQVVYEKSGKLVRMDVTNTKDVPQLQPSGYSTESSHDGDGDGDGGN